MALRHLFFSSVLFLQVATNTTVLSHEVGIYDRRCCLRLRCHLDDSSLFCVLSHHLLRSSPLPFTQVIHSLRASNRAFADLDEDESYWACFDYCKETTKFYRSSNGCDENCEKSCEYDCHYMTENQRRDIFKCKQISKKKSSRPKTWDECVCEKLKNCATTGSGKEAKSDPNDHGSSSGATGDDYDTVE